MVSSAAQIVLGVHVLAAGMSYRLGRPGWGAPFARAGLLVVLVSALRSWRRSKTRVDTSTDRA